MYNVVLLCLGGVTSFILHDMGHDFYHYELNTLVLRLDQRLNRVDDHAEK